MRHKHGPRKCHLKKRVSGSTPDSTTGRRIRTKLLRNYLNMVRESLQFSIENEKLRDVDDMLRMHTFHRRDEDSTTQLTSKITWSLFYIDKNRRDNPLHYACRLGKTCFIDLLLDTGEFDVNAANNSLEQDTPLCIACDGGWLDTVKLLIERGANVNIENGRHKTPLILATELIHPYDSQMCMLLMNAGAQVNTITRNRNTVMLSASKFGNIDLIDSLVQAGAEINIHFNDGATPLMRACYYNYIELVRYLLEKQTPIEAVNLRLETALYIAAFRGHYNIVKLMVDEYNANLNCEDIDGDTPLTVACYEEKPEVIKYLLERGAQVNKPGVRGDSPLHIAVSNCNNSVVSELIRRGALVDALNMDNETPLHIATRQNSLAILESLCWRATQLNGLSNYGNTPFRNLLENLSNSGVKLGMAACLIRAGCDVRKSFLQSVDSIGVCHFNSSPLECLFKFELSLDGFNDDNYLEYLAKNRHLTKLLVELVQLVVKSGYRPRMSDLKLYKQSWLHFSLKNTNNERGVALVEALLFNKFNRPNYLIDLCRVQIRNMLVKPLANSVQSLNISKQLKSFLLFE